MAFTTLALRANVWRAPISQTGVTPFSEARRVTTSKQSVEAMSVSHDGKWLAYDSNLNGNQGIFKITLEASAQSSDPVQLTHDSAAAWAPVWSPDDREIAYYSAHYGKRDIFVMGADGRNPKRVTDLPGRTWYPDWSPNGSRLVFTHEEEGGRVYVPYVIARSPDGWSDPHAVGNGSGERGSIDRWSPDGRHLSATSGDSLFIIEVATGVRRPIVDPTRRGLRVTAAEWGRDGTLFFHTSADTKDEFWSISVDGGPSRLVLRLDDPTRVTNRRQFATDGRQLFFTIAEDEGSVRLLHLKR
jgi:Tol biopolymer transport system component